MIWPADDAVRRPFFLWRNPVLSRRIGRDMIPIVLSLGAIASANASQKPDLTWWREARFGLFIHWGLYAIPAGKWGEKTHYGEWIRDSAQIPIKIYDQLVSQFNPVNFNANEWVSIAKDAGMRYLVITSKHHDGFALFDSTVSDYDVMATPFKRDIMREIADACRRQGIVPCWYYSIMDWHHPDYLPRRGWEKRSAEGADFERYFAYLKAQVAELVTNYGQIGVMWFDGEWESTWLPKYGEELLAHCRKLSPNTVVNNRVSQARGGMEDVGSRHGLGDFGTPEQYIPPTGFDGQDWETCMTIADHWGFNAYEANWKSSRTLIRNLIDIVSKGGNYLLNVGPRPDGTFPPECVDRLREIGEWMKVNSESIYGTQASPFESLPWGRCTSKPDVKISTLYFHVFDWPKNGELVIPGIGNEVLSARALGGEELDWRRDDANVVVALPAQPIRDAATTIELRIAGKPIIYQTPKIVSPGTEFVTSVRVTLEAGGLEMRFTLDGSEPTKSSEKYIDEIEISHACMLRAAAFANGKRVSDIAASQFKKVEPVSAKIVNRELLPGVELRIFSGNLDRLPDFNKLEHSDSRVAMAIAYGDEKPIEYIGRVYSGYLLIEETEMYEFALTADDGARLLIGDKVVVDNDGLHSAETKIGRIPLQEGLHPIRVEWFNKTGAVALEVTMAKIGSLRKPIDASALLR